MKYYTFERENNNFDDILADPSLKKQISETMTWTNHLRIGINDHENALKSYIMLKYGDEMRTALTKDYSPKPGIDYIPRKKQHD